MKNKIIAAPYLLWMVVFIVAPLIFVFYYAFTDYTGAFTFANITGLSQFAETFLNSVWLGAAAALISLVIGYPAAYFISTAKPSHQRLLVMLITLPMFMSFLLRTIAWVALLNDNGILNNVFKAIGIGPFGLIRNRGAVILGMVYNYVPYMILPLYTVLSKIDPKLLEASADLGAGKIETFRRTVFPLSVPGIISGITMVFVPAVSTFYISKKLGAATDTMIGDVIEKQFKSAYNPNLGAAMSLVLMLLIFVCMAIVNRFSDKDEEAIII